MAFNIKHSCRVLRMSKIPKTSCLESHISTSPKNDTNKILKFYFLFFWGTEEGAGDTSNREINCTHYKQYSSASLPFSIYTNFMSDTHNAQKYTKC